MIAVIIAGGSGTRLWPLSTPAYPKHLLTVNGDNQSLLQQTYQRAMQVADTVYVITEQSHAHHVERQLPDLHKSCILAEPARRGTANCMLAALTHVRKVHDADEPIFILWADHYIRDIDGFKHSIETAAAKAQRGKRITLIGIEPDHPATGFGYIQKGKLFDNQNFVFTVHSFHEKPDYETAKRYVKSGEYLWNCGYFIATLETFEKNMETYAPELIESYKKLQAATDTKAYQAAYLDLAPADINYALIEKAEDQLVVPATFDWLDLGSYGDLHKVTDSDEAGNHMKGEKIVIDGVENSFIQNYDDKPVVVIGLDNVVVVNTPDGLLVSRKDLSQKIGEASKRIEK